MKLGDIFFQGISDFWLRYFEDSDVLSDLYGGSLYEIATSYQNLMLSLASLSLEDAPSTSRVAWRPFFIDENSIIAVSPSGDMEESKLDSTGFLVEIPMEIRHFTLLSNVPINPTSCFEVDYDFEIILSDTRRLEELNGINPNVPLSGFFVFFKAISPFDEPRLDAPLHTHRFYPGRLFPKKVTHQEYVVALEAADASVDFYTDPSTGQKVYYDPVHTRVRVVYRGGGYRVANLEYISSSEVAGNFGEEAAATYKNRLFVRPGGLPNTEHDVLFFSVGTNAPLYNNLVDDTEGSALSALRSTRILAGWANEVQVDDFHMWHNFGYPFGNSLTASSETYRSILRAIWNAYVNSASVERLEAICNALSGYPVFRLGGLSDPPEVVDNLEVPASGVGEYVVTTTERLRYVFPVGTPLKAEVVFSAARLNGRPRDDRLGLWSDTAVSGYRDLGMRPGNVLVRIDELANIVDYATIEFVWDTFLILKEAEDYDAKGLRGDNSLVNFSWGVYTAAVKDDADFEVGGSVAASDTLFSYLVAQGSLGNVLDNSAVPYYPNQFSALTAVFSIDDEASSPGWWKSFGVIPPYLAEGVPRVRREVHDTQYANLLNEPEHIHVGDLGAIVGTDDDETVPSLTTAEGLISYEHVVASPLTRKVSTVFPLGGGAPEGEDSHNEAPEDIAMQVFPQAPAAFAQTLDNDSFVDWNAEELSDFHRPMLKEAGVGSEVDFLQAGVRKGDFLVVRGLDFPQSGITVDGWNTQASAVSQALLNQALRYVYKDPNFPNPDRTLHEFWSELLLPVTALVPIKAVSKTTLTLGAPLPWGTSTIAQFAHTKSTELAQVSASLPPKMAFEAVTNYLATGTDAGDLVGQPMDEVLFLSGQRAKPLARVTVLRAVTERGGLYTPDRSYTFMDLPGSPDSLDYKEGDNFNWKAFGEDWEVVAPTNPTSEVVVGVATANPGRRRPFSYLMFDRVYKTHLFSVGYDPANQKAREAWAFISSLIDVASPLHTAAYMEPSQLLRDIVAPQSQNVSMHLRGTKYDAVSVPDPTTEVGGHPAMFFEVTDIVAPGSAQEAAEQASISAHLGEGSIGRLAPQFEKPVLVLRGVPMRTYVPDDWNAAPAANEWLPPGQFTGEYVDLACPITHASKFTRNGVESLRLTIQRRSGIRDPDLYPRAGINAWVTGWQAKHSHPLTQIPGLPQSSGIQADVEPEEYFSNENLLARTGVTWELYTTSLTALLAGEGFVNPQASGTLGHVFGNNVGAGTGAIVGGPDRFIGRHDYDLDNLTSEDVTKLETLWTSAPQRKVYPYDSQAADPTFDVSVANALWTFSNVERQLVRTYIPSVTADPALPASYERSDGTLSQLKPHLSGYFSGDDLEVAKSNYRYNGYDITEPIPPRDSRPGDNPLTFAGEYPSTSAIQMLAGPIILDEPVEVLKKPVVNGVVQAPVGIVERVEATGSVESWALGMPNSSIGVDYVQVASTLCEQQGEQAWGPDAPRAYSTVEFGGPNAATLEYNTDATAPWTSVNLAGETSPYVVEIDPATPGETYTVRARLLNSQGGLLAEDSRSTELPLPDFAMSFGVSQDYWHLTAPSSTLRALIKKTGPLGGSIKSLHFYINGNLLGWRDWDSNRVVRNGPISLRAAASIRLRDKGDVAVEEVGNSYLPGRSIQFGQLNTLRVDAWDHAGDVRAQHTTTWRQEPALWRGNWLGDEEAEGLDETLKTTYHWHAAVNANEDGPADRIVYVIARVFQPPLNHMFLQPSPHQAIVEMEYYNATTGEYSADLPAFEDYSYADATLQDPTGNGEFEYVAEVVIPAPAEQRTIYSPIAPNQNGGEVTDAAYLILPASPSTGWIYKGREANIDYYAIPPGIGLYDKTGNSTVRGDLIQTETAETPIFSRNSWLDEPVDFDWEISLGFARGDVDANLEPNTLFDLAITVHRLGDDIQSVKLRNSDWTTGVDVDGWFSVEEGLTYTHLANGVLANGFMPGMIHDFEVQFVDTRGADNSTHTRTASWEAGPAMWMETTVNADGSITVTIRAVGQFAEDG